MPRVLSETDVADFRERLCEAATAIYMEKGPDGLNMRELAARLGVSAMTPYRYFKDKEDILFALRARAFNRFADQLEKALATPGTSPEKNVSQAYVSFALKQACSYRLMFDLSAARLGQPSELVEAEQRARAGMTNHVRQMVKASYICGDPELLGTVLWAGLHGVVSLRLTGGVAEDGEFENVLAETMRVFASAYRVR